MRQRRGKGLGLYGILIQGSLIETRYMGRERSRGEQRFLESDEFV